MKKILIAALIIISFPLTGFATYIDTSHRYGYRHQDHTSYRNHQYQYRQHYRQPYYSSYYNYRYRQPVYRYSYNTRQNNTCRLYRR